VRFRIFRPDVLAGARFFAKPTHSQGAGSHKKEPTAAKRAHISSQSAPLFSLIVLSGRCSKRQGADCPIYFPIYDFLNLKKIRKFLVLRDVQNVHSNRVMTQDLSRTEGGLGHTASDSGVALAALLTDSRLEWYQDLNGKHVFELGSGPGVTGKLTCIHVDCASLHARAKMDGASEESHCQISEQKQDTSLTRNEHCPRTKRGALEKA